MRFSPLTKAQESDANCSHAPSALPTFRSAALLGLLAILGFHLAYSSRHLSAAMLLFLYALVSLAALPTGRASFYAGLLVGLAVYAPQLSFFWSIFGPPAVTLWVVLAFWLGFFVLLAHHTRQQFSRMVAVVTIPFLWVGIEYFRSELYYLKFGWLSPGFAFSGDARAPIFATAGVYGIGFGLMAVASLLALFPRRTAVIAGISTMMGIALLDDLPAPESRQSDPGTNVVVAGVQVEFPMELEVPGHRRLYPVRPARCSHRRTA